MRDDVFKGNIIIIVTALSVVKKHQFLNFGADGTILNQLALLT